MSWMLLEYSICMHGFDQFHKISLLCYRQELACTPNDPPRRVDMNEISLVCFYNENDRVVDNTV